MIEPELAPQVIAAAAARIADLARRDLDAIYTARDATTLAHVFAACEVSRALAAAAEAVAYVADHEADGCTDCEPGPEEPEQFRDSYLCRWCGDDLSDRPDPAATEATCVYRIGGGARPASDAPTPPRPLRPRAADRPRPAGRGRVVSTRPRPEAGSLGGTTDGVSVRYGAGAP